MVYFIYTQRLALFSLICRPTQTEIKLFVCLATQKYTVDVVAESFKTKKILRIHQFHCAFSI